MFYSNLFTNWKGLNVVSHNVCLQHILFNFLFSEESHLLPNSVSELCTVYFANNVMYSFGFQFALLCTITEYHATIAIYNYTY